MNPMWRKFFTLWITEYKEIDLGDYLNYPEEERTSLYREWVQWKLDNSPKPIRFINRKEPIAS